MKILIIIPFIPYPLYSGGNQAFFSMVVSGLARRRRQDKET